VDVLVTQSGLAVNPLRGDLKAELAKSGLPVMDIEELRRMAERLNGVPQKPRMGDRIVGRVIYRDGTVIDEIRQAQPGRQGGSF
jgi:citrate lyase subunit alpha/citrate CoA-transferase